MARSRASAAAEERQKCSPANTSRVCLDATDERHNVRHRDWRTNSQQSVQLSDPPKRPWHGEWRKFNLRSPAPRKLVSTAGRCPHRRTRYHLPHRPPCSARPSQSLSSTRRPGRPPSPPCVPRSLAVIMRRSSRTMRGPGMCVPRPLWASASYVCRVLI